MPTLSPMATIAPAQTHWLWQNYLPTAGLSLLLAPPSAGKTSLALDLAARLSTGTPLPAATPPIITPTLRPRPTLLLAPAVPASTDLRPRLDALGANLNHIHLLADTHALGTVDDLTPLLQACQQLPDLALIVIDPISFYFPRWHTPDARTRDILLFLTTLARARNLCILMTAPCPPRFPCTLDHSRALASLPTSLFAAIHLLTPSENSPTSRLLIPLKSPAPALPPSLSFTPGGSPAWSAADQPPARRDAILQEALCFLRKLLKDGPVRSLHVRAAAGANAVSFATLKRAKEHLNITVCRKNFNSPWYWSLAGTPKFPTDPAETAAELEKLDKKQLLEKIMVFLGQQ